MGGNAGCFPSGFVEDGRHTPDESALMVATLSRVSMLLIAVAILLMGHGLQLTLLPMHAQAVGWSAYAVGVTGSLYFLGFVIGCVLVPSIVARVGHIRTFMVMGALATIALLLCALVVEVPAWGLFRFATGFALSGLYMVIESWLSEVAPVKQRGTVLAVYTMICLLAMSVGQSFLGFISPEGLELFLIGAMLLCLAIVPIGVARMAAPRPLPSARFSPRVLLKASRVAVVVSFLSALVTGAFWTVGPLVGRAYGLDAGGVGIMMSAGILGGAFSQLPIGRLSDRFDRRAVIGVVLAFGAAICVVGWFFAGVSALLLYGVMFMIGAATMPVYALCIGHASENTSIPMVEVASGILVMNSLGSIVGPMAVAALMDTFGPASFFGYAFVGLFIAAVFTFYRLAVVERPHHTDHPIPVLPRTTQVVAELSDEYVEPGLSEPLRPDER